MVIEQTYVFSGGGYRALLTERANLLVQIRDLRDTVDDKNEQLEYLRGIDETQKKRIQKLEAACHKSDREEYLFRVGYAFPDRSPAIGMQCSGYLESFLAIAYPKFKVSKGDILHLAIERKH